MKKKDYNIEESLPSKRNKTHQNVKKKNNLKKKVTVEKVLCALGHDFLVFPLPRLK